MTCTWHHKTFLVQCTDTWQLSYIVYCTGEQEMEVIEKRKAWEEYDETQASHFIRCLLFLCFQAPFLFKVSGATLFCERYLGCMSSEQVMVMVQQ